MDRCDRKYCDGIYDARSIANYILDRIDARSNNITNAKINKILFFIQGWGLAELKSVLIRNHFEAWDYGPVIRVVYDSFKSHRDDYIDTRAMAFNYFCQFTETISYEMISEDHRAFVMFIASNYMKFSAGQLIDKTHEYGTPWEIVRRKVDDGQKRLSKRIPNELIQKYFESLLKPSGILQ